MNTINFRNLVLLLSASTVHRCSELDIRPHRSSYYNFTLSDPISQTVRSVYDYVCGATVFCNNSLGRFEWKRESCYKCQECHCDTLCYVYGDCCIDKYDYKPPPYPLPYTTCLQFNPKTCETQKKMPVYYRAINRCPFNFEKIDVVRKCQSTDISDYETALAVWSISTNKTYINIFCALCHGELSRDMRRWSAYVSCRDETIFNGLQDYGAIWRTAMSHNSCCIHKIKEPNGALERPCKPDVVDNCPQKANKTVLDLYMEDNCNSTGFDVFDYTSKITYRNVFCAACNGVVIARFLHGACFMQHELRTKSLGVLINFNPIIKDVTIDSNSQEKSICTGTEVIDPLTTTCHKVVCDGRRFLDGDRCVNIFGDAKGLGYVLKYTLTPKVNISHFAPIIALDYNIYVGDVLDRDSIKFTNFTVKVSGVISPSNISIEYPASNGEMITIHSIDIDHIDVDMAVALMTVGSITELELKFRRLLEHKWVLYEGLEFQPAAHDLCIVQGDDISHHNNETFIEEIFSYPFEPFACAIQSPSPCKIVNNYARFDLNALICPHITYKMTDVIEGDGYLIIGNANITVNASEYSVCHNTVKVCKQALDNHYKTSFEEPIKDASLYNSGEFGQTVASIVATTLSLCGSALTLMTYSLFSVLRTTPGINTMMLTSHLFLAQLFYQATVAVKVTYQICLFFGLLVHYFWLATFAWMCVAGYHMFTIFRKVIISGNRKPWHKFLGYTFFANGSPILVISACIIKNYVTSGGDSVGYGDNLCFIRNGSDIGIFMALPLGLVIVANIIFFAIVVRSIHSTSESIKSSVHQNHHHAGVYLKLAILLGFTWIFGFLASALHIEALWYLFIVTSGCQGLLLFFAYCFNKRVLNMYLSILGKVEIQSNVSSKRTMTTNT